MDVTEKNLEKFRAWMVQRGRMAESAALYATNIRICAADPKGITHRLVAGKLAPNTLRTNLASLRAWALFADDTALLRRLSDIRLPPARRVRTKTPLDFETWKKLVRHLKDCAMPCEAMRQVLLIMALRGIRSGDVMRIRRTEVVRALENGRLVFEGKGRKRMEYDARPIQEQLEALSQMTGWTQVRDLLIDTGECQGRILSKKVWRSSRRAASGAGIADMNPHRFRHTFATNFLKQLAGDPNAIVRLQRYMGWESMATAARYVDAISGDELDQIGAGMVDKLLR